MRYRNIFKTVKKNEPLKYSDVIIEAVLNPRISGLVLNFNGGLDWVDRRYGFIKLLLERGQISALKSGSDLLACPDYLEALTSGHFVNVVLEPRIGLAYASAKRIKLAQEKLYSHALKYHLEKAV